MDISENATVIDGVKASGKEDCREVRELACRPVIRRRAKNGRLFSHYIRFPITCAIVLIPWAIVTAFGWIKPVILPTPWAVLVALGRLLVHQNIWIDAARTVGRLVAALGIAISIGVPAGLWLGHNRKLYRLIEGPIHALRSLPSAALFPLFLIVIGVSESSIVALAAYNSLLVVLINTIVGASLANRQRLYQARLLGLGGWRIVKDILFWEALPHILAGIRIAIGYGLALVIAVEMFIGISKPGLGRRIFDFQAAYRIPETYASILIAAFVGMALNGCLTIIERRLLRWLPRSA